MRLLPWLGSTSLVTVPALFRDDNNQSLPDPSGLGGVCSTGGIKVATTGATTAEVSIAGFHALADTPQGSIIVRIANIGSNAALYAFGPAGAGASFTGNSTMQTMAPNSIEFRRVDASQVSLYHRQVTGPNTIQVTLLS